MKLGISLCRAEFRCLPFAGRKRDANIDRQCEHQSGAAESKEDRIVASGLCEDPRKTISSSRLEQGKAGRGVAPHRSLLLKRVRHQFMHPSKDQGHDTGREGADHHA